MPFERQNGPVATHLSLANILDDGHYDDDDDSNETMVLHEQSQQKLREKRLYQALQRQKTIFSGEGKDDKGGRFFISAKPTHSALLSFANKSNKRRRVAQSIRSRIRADSNANMSKFRRPKILGFKKFFLTWKTKERKERTEYKKKQYITEKWKSFTINPKRIALTDGLEKFNSAIHALNRLDEMGFRRSKQQIEFHTLFLGSMVQQIFGSDLNKYLNDILEALGLKELNKDVAVCCPRRFGKTTSVALFAAAMVYTQGDIDFVIYSIAMRTSRMLTARIYQMIVGLAGGNHVIITSNQEVLTVASLCGGASTVYSYPGASAISTPSPLFFFIVIYTRMALFQKTPPFRT